MTINLYQQLKAAGTTLRILANGVDVTQHCVEANDVEGWALVNKADENGKHYVEDGEIARERLTGDIEFKVS